MHVWYGKRSKKWRDWPWDTLSSNVNTYTPDLTALFIVLILISIRLTTVSMYSTYQWKNVRSVSYFWENQ